jgi:hypothetical protein
MLWHFGLFDKHLGRVPVPVPVEDTKAAISQTFWMTYTQARQRCEKDMSGQEGEI